MTIQKHLDTLRSQFKSCDLTAFGDLSSVLILRSSSDETCQREVLDDLMRRAVESFAVAGTTPDRELADPSFFGRSVVMLQSGKSYVFAREEPESDEVTCAVLNAPEETTAAIQSSRSCAHASGNEDT